MSAGPAAALRMLAWEPADRCDATRGNLQADRVDAAEATSPFCAWFCAWSSSQSSSPRTSSSIWLSSPYCPPSHRDGDLRNSAVANRHALHSDYYSTMRKTATPLNESWMTASRRHPGVRRIPRLRSATRAAARARARRTRRFPRNAKVPVAQAFSTYEPISIAQPRTPAHAAASVAR